MLSWAYDYFSMLVIKLNHVLVKGVPEGLITEMSWIRFDFKTWLSKYNHIKNIGCNYSSMSNFATHSWVGILHTTAHRYSKTSQGAVYIMSKGWVDLEEISFDSRGRFTHDFLVSNLMDIFFYCNSILACQIPTNICIWHDSNAVMPCANVCRDHFIEI